MHLPAVADCRDRAILEEDREHLESLDVDIDPITDVPIRTQVPEECVNLSNESRPGSPISSPPSRVPTPAPSPVTSISSVLDTAAGFASVLD